MGDPELISTPRPLLCPRCGYDQRGVVETWTGSCPLRGRCAECGLEFLWGELLGWKLEYPRWCVERKDGRFIRPRQFFGTLVRTFMPWIFWRQIRMTHRNRWRRIIAYCLVLLALLYLSFAVGHGLFAAGSRHQRIHDGGALAYGGSGGVVFFQAAGLPLSERSLGWTRSWGRRHPYETPQELLERWGAVGLPTPSIFLRQIPQVYLIPVAVVSHLMCGLAFVVLPYSRRRAKVRSAHVARVTLYGSALLVPAIALLLLSSPGAWYDWSGAALLGSLMIASFLAVLPLELAWWTIAASRYLRMAQPLAIGLSVVILGFFTPFAVGAFIWSLR